MITVMSYMDISHWFELWQLKSGIILLCISDP